MGKELRREHINFFTARMNEHDRVISWELIPHDHEFLFKIVRTVQGVESDVTVHLTDAYVYGMAEFITRPDQLNTGSFVVIGMPHASADPEVIEKAKEYGIGIGQIGKFMGALNFKNIWEYMTADERESEDQRLGSAELEY